MLIIPVNNMTLAPNALIYVSLDQLKKNAGGKGFSLHEKLVLIAQKDGVEEGKYTEESFYPIGVLGTIEDIHPQGYAVIRTQYRVNLDMIALNPDGTIDLTISRRSDIEDLEPSLEQEKLADLKKEMRGFSEGLQWAEAADQIIGRIDTLETAVCVISPFMELSQEQRYEVLAEDRRARRAEIIEKLLYDFLEVGRIRNEAMSSQQKDYQKMYKEAAIKRQMEHLQKELDEMHPENVSDVRRFEKKIAESGMNETAKKEAEKVLNRLKQEGKENAESGMLYDWLDFVTGLSWKKEAIRHIDLSEAQRILDEDHYGLKKVKERIIQQIAVMNLKKEQSGSILLFVGAPGTGKTSIGKSIARALGREYARVSLGGVHDESDIRGHRRTYIGAMPGRIMDGVSKSGVSNPVMVLDEVDKLSDSFHGSPASALLEVLDPEQNNSFTDHYMNVPYDLSDVLFICTANTTDTIPEPLLNRMEVIRFNGYTPQEKLQIAKEHLVRKSEEQMGIEKEQLEFTEEALDTLISDYTMEAGVRGLRKHIDTICRKLAVKISEHPEEKISVSADMVREEMDMHPVEHERVLESPKPGVVTGLAWTPVGGEILYIETLASKGEGKLTITGQLGDVMKESAMIALSLVKNLFPERAKFFRENDLHIHVPAGAVPKDGPSAGVTLTTALSSLLLNRAVDPTIAMTGEVSLRGAVTPIGGLPEKLLAADRAGIRRVFIPKANVLDLRDVPEEVKQHLEIIPVSSVSELLIGAGLMSGSCEEESIAG